MRRREPIGEALPRGGDPCRLQARTGKQVRHGHLAGSSRRLRHRHRHRRGRLDEALPHQREVRFVVVGPTGGRAHDGSRPPGSGPRPGPLGRPDPAGALRLRPPVRRLHRRRESHRPVRHPRGSSYTVPLDDEPCWTRPLQGLPRRRRHGVRPVRSRAPTADPGPTTVRRSSRPPARRLRHRRLRDVAVGPHHPAADVDDVVPSQVVHTAGPEGVRRVDRVQVLVHTWTPGPRRPKVPMAP